MFWHMLGPEEVDFCSVTRVDVIKSILEYPSYDWLKLVTGLGTANQRALFQCSIAMLLYT